MVFFSLKVAVSGICSAPFGRCFDVEFEQEAVGLVQFKQAEKVERADTAKPEKAKEHHKKHAKTHSLVKSDMINVSTKTNLTASGNSTVGQIAAAAVAPASAPPAVSSLDNASRQSFTKKRFMIPVNYTDMAEAETSTTAAVPSYGPTSEMPAIMVNSIKNATNETLGPDDLAGSLKDCILGAWSEWSKECFYLG